MTATSSPIRTTAPTQKPRRKSPTGKWIVGLFTATGLLGLGGGIAFGASGTEAVAGSGSFVGPATVDVEGVFVVPQDYGYFTNPVGDCNLSVGYADFEPGASITLENGEGKTTVGHLGAAISDGSDCLFEFHFNNVEIAEGDYVVEFSHRGALTVTLDELREGLALTM